MDGGESNGGGRAGKSAGGKGMRIGWGWAWLLLAVAGLLVHSHPLVLLVYGMGILWATSAWAVRRACAGLLVRQRLSATHLAAGQPLEVQVTLINPSRWPVPWLWLQVHVPVHLESQGALQALTGVRPGRSTAVRFTLRPARRGRYCLGQITLRAGDWFGFTEVTHQVELPLWVTIYPPLYPVAPLPPYPRVPFGGRRDPISPFLGEQIQGLRRYRAGDPVRWIAWRATARTGVLQVKEFPRVRERCLTVVLDLDLEAWRTAWGVRGVERMLAVAASLLRSPVGGDGRTGLLAYGRLVRYVAHASGVLEDPPRLVWVRPGQGVGHLRRLLDALAVLQPTSGGPPLARLLLQHASRVLPGEELFIFTGAAEPQACRVAAAMARRGHPVTWGCLGAPPALPLPGVRVLPVSLEGEVRWA